MSTVELSQFIRTSAKNLGFTKFGISPATAKQQSENRLDSWLQKGYHSTMRWMEKRADERGDIGKYYPEAKSVISLGLNYFTGNTSPHPDIGKISNYAWGDDYHDLIKSRLYNLLSEIKSEYPQINGIACVDTSPIMEKDWAQLAGQRADFGKASLLK